MNRTLSLKTLCVISICLATASVSFCWRWTARSAARLEMQEREIEALKAIRDDLEFNMLNLGALVVNAAQGSYGADRPLPVTGLVARDYESMMSSPRMQAIEKARADDFLYWYYRHMEDRHSELASDDGYGGEEAIRAGKDENVSPPQSPDLAALGPFPLDAPILVGFTGASKDDEAATGRPSLDRHRWRIAASDHARARSSSSDCQTHRRGGRSGRNWPTRHGKMAGSGCVDADNNGI